MPLPLGNVGEYSVPQMSSPVGFSESTGQNSIGLTEHNYLGLPDTSSEESSVVTSGLHDKESSLNLKATELRLGLPGSQSPVRDAELSVSRNPKLDEKNLFPKISLKEAVDEENSRNSLFTNLQKTIVSGNKRGYADAMDGFADGKFLNNAGVIAASATSAVGAAKQGSAIWHQKGSDHVGSAMLSSRPSPNHVAKNLNPKEQGGSSSAMMKEIASGKISHERAHAPNNGAAPAAKAQVVGWPPIRSYRKNVLAANMKTSEEVDGKPGSGPLFVKVSMDGAPYLRKVDLKACSTYGELSSALEKMFSCFTIGQCGSHGVPGRDMLSESKLVDLLHGSEYVLTYEDKDMDWMLVGDVPWEMFIDSCRRLRIMKGSDAIGLAPRAMEKCRNRN